MIACRPRGRDGFPRIRRKRMLCVVGWCWVVSDGVACRGCEKVEGEKVVGKGSGALSLRAPKWKDRRHQDSAPGWKKRKLRCHVESTDYVCGVDLPMYCFASDPMTCQ